MLLDLVVYADGLTIPPQVFEHHTLRRLRQDAADIIAWATVRCHECALLGLLTRPRRILRRTRSIRALATLSRSS